MSRRTRATISAAALLSVISAVPLAGAVTSAAAAAPAWPSYESSVCGAPAHGYASCHAVQLLSPAQHWAPGPWAHRSEGFGPVGSSARSGQVPTPPGSGYYPIDIQNAYGLTATASAMSPGSSAPTVAIVDAYDDPNAASDLSAFRASMSGAKDPNTGLMNPVLPPLCSASVTSECVNFTKVNELGGTSYPSPNTGWSEEISLDLDTVSGVCPDCNIVLVEASTSSLSDLATAVGEAEKFSPAVVTNSYGGGETSSETAFNSTYSATSTTAITAAAGDGGYGVEYPAAAPNVTAVGGTSLTYTGTGPGVTWQPQSVWDDSGSGCSAVETMPSWQADPSVYSSSGCDGRQVADISAVADPETGYAAYDSFHESGWLVFGGTSLSTQVIGAAYAVASTAGHLATSPQAFYVDAGTSSTGPTPGLAPVTSGSNGSCGSYLCNAASSLSSGYNGPGGLGTPTGVSAFLSTASSSGGSSGGTTPPSTMTVTVTTGSLSGHRGSYSVPITVTATSSSSGAGVAGAGVALSVHQGSACSGTVAASGSFTTGSNGQVALTFHTGTATTWCVAAAVTATGYSPANGQAVFST